MRSRLVGALGCLLLLGACDSSPDHDDRTSAARTFVSRRPASQPPATSTPAGPTAVDSTSPSSGLSSGGAATGASGPTSPSSRPTAVTGSHPTGALLGHVRIIAYYGAAGGGNLGVLGATPPEQAAEAIERRAAGYAGFGRPVQPAMELIATVAQGSAGPDGDYSAPVAPTVIRTYLAVAHRHHMLLILDLQPGRASFLSQAKLLSPLLLDPSVHLGLDPEWKVGPSGRPGNGLIGSSSAAGINAVGAWLSSFVRAHRLPDKLLVVHEFTLTMLPDRRNITQHAGVEMALHADGFGHPSSKITIFHQLAFPHPPFGVGFKLFLTQDSRLMTPAEVMRLSPRPDIVTYQ